MSQTSLPSLFTKSFEIPFTGSEGSNLLVAALRYTKEAEPPKSGDILICPHAVGCHKEQWKPTVDRLFTRKDLDIAEVWTLDGPNHGDSLWLNMWLLEKERGLEELASLYTIGRLMYGVVKSNVADFQHRNIIGVGHSAGSAALILASMEYAVVGHPIPFKTIILLEPVMLPYEVGLATNPRVGKMTIRRKWQWDSREDALEFLRTTPPWSRWNPEVQQIYVEHGMFYDPVTGKVQLKTPPHIEAACYPSVEAGALARDLLPAISDRARVHLIIGSKNDLVSKSAQDDFVAYCKACKVCSIQVVPGAGHMIPQQSPDGCAEAIANVLKSKTAGQVSAKL